MQTPYNYTGAAAGAQAQDSAHQQWYGDYTTALQHWRQSRQPYQQAVGDSYEAAQTPGLATANADNMRQQAFHAGRTGTTRGSADYSRRATNQQSYAQALAQLHAQGLQRTQQQQDADMTQSNQWQAAAVGMDPGAELSAGVQAGAQQARAGQSGALAQSTLNQYQNQQQYQQLLSQIMGGQMSTAGGVLKSAAQSGNFNPAWAQALNQYYLGGG